MVQKRIETRDLNDGRHDVGDVISTAVGHGRE